jgi:hypothetical protein
VKVCGWLLALAAGGAAALFVIACSSSQHSQVSPTPPVAAPAAPAAGPASTAQSDQSAKAAAAVAAPLTRIHAHNLSLRRGPDFRVYILWLSGQLIPTSKDKVPSLDEANSFAIEVQNGVIHARMADISHYMNAAAAPATPLRNISITSDGDHISIHGTLHKLHVPLPIALEGTVSAASDDRIRLHVDHLALLKLPVKGVLGSLNLTVADLMGNKQVAGIEASGDDLYFDTQVLLPAPHIRGKLTNVHVSNPDIVVMYGDNAQDDAARTEQWHNFLSLKGGTLGFGKLTMRQVDLIMIDAIKDPWFDLDLVNYQAQLVYGYTRMTPQAGLQIFMPDAGQLPRPQTPRTVGAEWIKNRNLPPPAVGLPAR